MPGAPVGQPAGHPQAERAEAAGDHVRAVGAQRSAAGRPGAGGVGEHRGEQCPGVHGGLDRGFGRQQRGGGGVEVGGAGGGRQVEQ